MSYSANFVKAAIDKAFNRPLNPAIALTPDETQKLQTLDMKIKQKFVTQPDQTIIKRDGLVYRHHNDEWVFFSTTPGQTGRMEAAQAQYWYRSMNEGDYTTLKRTNEVAENASFGGVCTNRNYALGYLNNNTGKLIVEWHIPPAGRLFELMTAAGIGIKPEGDGGTYGLGDKGTQDHRAGSHDRVSARDVFLEYCGSRFKVVDLKIANALTGM